MRVALVLASLAVALVAAQRELRQPQPLAQRDVAETRRPVDYAPAFRANHEYFYEWNSQLASGLNGATQHAIQRMRAQIRFMFTSENAAVVQVGKNTCKKTCLQTRYRAHQRMCRLLARHRRQMLHLDIKQSLKLMC